jgi:hypothetical protein
VQQGHLITVRPQAGLTCSNIERALAAINQTPARLPCRLRDTLSCFSWTGAFATCDARKLMQEEPQQELGLVSASSLAQALASGSADAFARAASQATASGAQATAAAEALSQVAGQGQAQAAATALAQAASQSKYDGHRPLC